MDPLGDLLHATGTRALRLRLGEEVEHLEFTGAQTMGMQGAVELALDARVQPQDVAPLVHERPLGPFNSRHGRTVAKIRD
jgi:hypothetical protein